MVTGGLSKVGGYSKCVSRLFYRPPSRKCFGWQAEKTQRTTENAFKICGLCPDTYRGHRRVALTSFLINHVKTYKQFLCVKKHSAYRTHFLQNFKSHYRRDHRGMHAEKSENFVKGLMVPETILLFAG
jgi:hypothetical protein